MGALHDAKVQVENLLREAGADASALRGKISLRSGVMLALVRPETADDPAKLEKLRAAVKAVLGKDI